MKKGKNVKGKERGKRSYTQGTATRTNYKHKIALGILHHSIHGVYCRLFSSNKCWSAEAGRGRGNNVDLKGREKKRGGGLRGKCTCNSSVGA